MPFEYPLLRLIHQRQHPTVCCAAIYSKQKRELSLVILKILTNAADHKHQLDQTLVYGNDTNNNFIFYY